LTIYYKIDHKLQRSFSPSIIEISTEFKVKKTAYT